MVSLLLSCNSRKNANDTNPNGMEDVVIDSMRPDSLHHPSPDEFTDGHMTLPSSANLPMRYNLWCLTRRLLLSWTIIIQKIIRPIFDIYYFQKISASRVFTAEAEDLTLNVKKVGIRIASLEERYVGGPHQQD